MAGVGRRGSYTIAAIILIVHSAASAPVTEEGTSHSLQLGDVNGDGRGCYYNFEHYDEGDRIMTNEPCLNCTCHNRMLMCYLRVCPFTKAIGQDCTVEKKPDQCCPIITCPQVPVALLTSSTTSETPPTTTALGRPDNYGCILEGNTFYPDGAQVPSDPRKPCELCYCIRNHTACVMQECTLNVEGCKPVYQEGVCCPVRYNCDYDEVLTTPKPVGLVTTPGGSSDCLHNGVVYHDGAMVLKDAKAPCEHCYCMRGDIVCAVQECGTPLEGTDCSPMEPTPGQCCPNYHCANGTMTSEAATSDLTSTEKIPEAVKEEGEVVKQDSDEASNETDNSSEESKESLAESQPPQPVEGHEETPSHHEEPNTEAPEQSNIPEETPATVSSLPSSENDQPAEESQDSGFKPEVSPAEEEHTGDSESEASQHQVSEAQVPEEPAKDPQVINEIPESTPYEQLNPASVTDEPPVEVARVPGEGSCLVEGKTFAHNTIVPTTNPCQEVCRCFSSIVSCKPRDCPPAPSPDENCMPVITPGSCCPTYMCDQKTSDAPEAQDHKIDEFPVEENLQQNEESPTTAHQVPEDVQATDAPVVTDLPPDSAIAESHEHVLPAEPIDEGSAVSENEEVIPTTVEPASDVNKISDENGEVNSHIVHEMDAALHGGQPDHMDSHEKGESVQHTAHSTVGPASESNVIADETGEEGFNAVTTYSTNESGETAHSSSQHEGTVKPDESAFTEQDEGSGQEDTEPLPDVEKINNEAQDQTVPVNTESDNEVLVGTTASTNLLEDGHEGQHVESVSQENLNLVNSVVSSSPEEVKNEDGLTSIPPHPQVSSEETYQPTEESNQAEEQTNSPLSQSAQDTHSDETQTTEGQQVQQENVQEVTTASSSPDVSQDSVSEEHVDSQKEVEVSSETSQESASVSDPQDSGLEATTATVIESQPDESNKAQEGNEVDHDIQSSTDLPIANLPEEAQEPVSSQSTSEESVTAVPVPEEIHHDAVPDSSQHNEETADINTSQAVVDDAQTNEEESPNTETVESVTEHKVPEDANDSSTSIPQTQINQDSSEQLTHDDAKPSENTEEDINGSEMVEKHTDISTENSPQETKPAELVTSSALPSEDVTTPKPSSEATVPSNSEDSSSIDDSTIIYEEVRVTGMPSIESHVTEGTSDIHLAVSSTAAPENPLDAHIPGPEGIKVEEEAEKEASVENSEINVVQPEVPSEPVSIPSDQIPEVDEPEKNAEDITTSEGEENKAPQDTNEAGSVVSETIHHGTKAPEITNEINEEKDSLNKIPHDTAQLVEDINQTIQNEVSNELIPGEDLEHVPTDEPIQSPTESAPESQSVQPSGEILNNEDRLQETTAAPLSNSGDSEAIPEVSSSAPAAETNEDKKAEDQSVNENSNNDLPEEKPSQNIEEESHVEPESTTAILTPDEVPSQTEASSHSVEESPESSPSAPLEEESPSEQTNQNEEEKAQDEPSGVAENESSSEPAPIAQTEINEADQSNSAYDSTQSNVISPVTDEPSGSPVQTSENENQDGNLNDLSTEKSEEAPKPEKEPTKEQDIASGAPASEDQLSETANQASPEGELKPSVSEDQNAIVEDVTHVEGIVPQLPDSANQLLESAVEHQNTEKPTQALDSSSNEGESQSPQVVSEDHIQPHEDSVPAEGNKNEIPIDSEQQTNEHESQENPTEPQETPIEHQETPVEHQETPVEHQETPVEYQETPVEHQETPVEHQETPVEHHETPVEHHETPVEHQETPVEHQETPVEHQETPVEHQETPVEHQETPVEHQETPVEHQETPVEHQEMPVEPQETPEEHHETHVEPQETPVEPQETTVAPQETPEENHEIPVEPQETPSENQESSSEPQETPSQPQEIPSETENAPTEHQETPSEIQELVTEHQETVTERQETASEPQETSSEHSEINPEPIVTEHQEVVSEPQETASEHQETVTEHQETVTEQQETVTEHQETVTEKQETASQHQETVSEPQETASEHQEIVSEPQETVSEVQESSTEHQEIAAEPQETASEQQETISESQETVKEETTTGPLETVSEHLESSSEQTNSVIQETGSDHLETIPGSQETVSEHQETVTEQGTGPEHHETVSHHDEALLPQQETAPEQQETVTESQEVVTVPAEEINTEQGPISVHQTSQPLEGESLHQEPVTEIHDSIPEHQEAVTEQQEMSPVQQESDVHHDTVTEHQENLPVSQEPNTTEHPESPFSEEQTNIPHQPETVPQQPDNVSEQETASQSQDLVTELTPTETVHEETSSEHSAVPAPAQETVPEQTETASEHHDTASEHEEHIPTTEPSNKQETSSPTEVSSEVSVSEGHVSTERIHEPSSTESQAVQEEGQKQEVPTTLAPQISVSSESPTSSEALKPEQISEQIQSIIHSTETAIFSEIPSSTQKPIIEEPSPMFPSWSQKPFDHHTTPEPHTPEENPYPSGFDPEYEDEEGASYGPGTCRYGGKVYLSAQQIPRDDPCDFCFCFRSDIICLQQSCPPPIRGCYQETIKGFCCPRYECHVSMATMLNITTTTTTTTTTLPPHFFAHAYNGAATKAGCQVKGVAYHVGERIPSTSGPCLECRCGANGQMKCDPTVCGPQEALLRQVMDAAVSKRRR